LAKSEQGISIVIDNRNISVSVFTKNLEKAGEYFADSLKPESPVLNSFLSKKVKPILRKSVKMRFATQTDLDNKPWKSLSKFRFHQRNKRSVGYGGGILDDSGKLKRSIRYAVTGNTLQAVSSSPYAWVHQQPISVSVAYKGGFKGMWQSNWVDNDTRGFVKTGKKSDIGDIVMAPNQVFKEGKWQQRVFEKAVFIPERTFLGFTPQAVKRVDMQLNKLIKGIAQSFLNGLLLKQEVDKLYSELF